MSTTHAALIVAAVLAVALPAAWWQIRNAQRHQFERDCIIDAAHERAERAAQLDDLELAWSMPAYDPELNAGCDRLWDAIRDEQQKGEL
ncbi:MAG: hypothetical protein HOV92_00640 [Streptomyces sp.]|nr:hypothetical protein [Streptomyces sp.]